MKLTIELVPSNCWYLNLNKPEGLPARVLNLKGINSLDYREKHYSIESIRKFSRVREISIEYLGKVLLDC